MSSVWSSSRTGWLRRPPRGADLLLIGLVLLGGPILAQGRGVLELDPENGAATLRLPLGPGIGQPGLRFVPALVGKFAPQVELASEGAPARVAVTGFELTPGTLEVWRVPGASPVARWTGPDGSGGRTRDGADPSPGPFGLAGLGGESLSALPELTGADGGELTPDGFPSGVRVACGALAYEYQREAASGQSPGRARYRLTAIRAASGEAVTFTYGTNGVDFEAALGTAKVRVAMAGTTEATSAPAPGDPSPGQDPKAAVRRDLEARLEVTYTEAEAGFGYAFTALLPPDRLAGVGSPVSGSLLQALQVTRVEGADPGERIEFRYGKAPSVGQAGSLASTVLREIVLPGRSLELEWSGRPGRRSTDGGESPGEGWNYGVCALRERCLGGAPVEEAACWKAAPESEGRTGSAPAGSWPQSWARQSRHFALDGGPGADPTCRTLVRDRWALGGGAAAQADKYQDGDDIPTLEWDQEAGALVPVPGQLTRCLNWSGSAGDPGQAPDMHGGRPPADPGRLRLLGGMYRARDPKGHQGAGNDESKPKMKVTSGEPKGQKPKESGQPKPSPLEFLDASGEKVIGLPPEYHPAKGEATLSIVAGGVPAGSGAGGISGVAPGPGTSRAQVGQDAVAAQFSANQATQKLSARTAELHRQIGESVAKIQAEAARQLETMSAQAEMARAQALLASQQQHFEYQQQMLDDKSAARGATISFMSGRAATKAAEANQQWIEAAEEAAKGATMAAENARRAVEAKGWATEAERLAAASERQAAESVHRATVVRTNASEGEREATEAERRVAELQRQTAEILERARMAEARKGKTADSSLAVPIPQLGVPPPAPVPEPNLDAIKLLRPIAESEEGKPGEVLILFWDWEGAGVVGEGASVGHVASALKIKDRWTIVHSQFPHESGGKPKVEGPNITIREPNTLFREEGKRKPATAYLVTVPNLGGLAGWMVGDLEKPYWQSVPVGKALDSTNCTYGTIHALRAGGVPLSSLWANQTLIIPGMPYTPRDLRTALKRDEQFNVIHQFKIHHRNDLIDAIEWENPTHD